MKDGIIATDSDRGEQFEFTSERFAADSYLWKMGDAIIVSFIASNARGNFRRLVARIHELGFTVKVPTPLGRMQQILLKNGYRHTREWDEDSGEAADVWILDPPAKETAATP